MTIARLVPGVFVHWTRLLLPLVLLSAPAWAQFSAEDFPARYVVAVRAALTASHLPAEAEPRYPPENYAEQLRSVLAEGSFRIVPAQAAACLAALKGLTTPVLWSARETGRPALALALEACRAVEEGARVDGASCHSWFARACRSGFCERMPPAERAPRHRGMDGSPSDGRCAPAPVRPPCQGEGRGDCRVGQVCRSGVCGAPGKLLGEACVGTLVSWNRDDPGSFPGCAEGLCFDSRCVAALPAGAVCADNGACAEGLYCRPTADGARCSPRKILGEICDGVALGSLGMRGRSSVHWLTGDLPLTSLERFFQDGDTTPTDRECVGTQVCAGRIHGGESGPMQAAGSCAVPRGVGGACTPGPKPREGLHVRTGCLPDLSCDRKTRRCVKTAPRR